MKALFVALAFGLSAIVSATAADLPTVKGPPPAPAETPFSWTGFYIGGQIGYAWNSGSFNNSIDPNAPLYALPVFSLGDSGVIGGAHAGYNYQIGQFVIGAEGEFDFTGINGWNQVVPYPYGTALIHTTQNELGAIDAKLGYAFDRFLVSAVGGVAFTKYSLADQDLCEGPCGGLGILYARSYPGGYRTGWTIGASIDYALTNSWIFGVDYRYYDFGSANVFSGYPVTPAGPGLDGLKVQETENALTASASYKF